MATVIFACAIICFHVFGGGMKAVAWMDTFNFILGVGTLWVLVVVLVVRNFDGGMVGVFNAIKKYKPEFEMDYDVDPLKQANADSWPNSLSDVAAQQEWDWKAEYDLDKMTVDMLAKLREKLIR